MKLYQNFHDWVEITSSGLTHTCAESILTRWLCPRMLSAFPRHRVEKSKYLDVEDQDGVFIGRNFGSLDIYPGNSSEASSIVISIHDLDHLDTTAAQDIIDSSVVLRQRVYSHAVSQSDMTSNDSFMIVSHSEYPEFPSIWQHLPNTWWGLVVCAIRPKSWIFHCILCCIYFQYKCFELIRSQMHLYAGKFKK